MVPLTASIAAPLRVAYAYARGDDKRWGPELLSALVERQVDTRGAKMKRGDTCPDPSRSRPRRERWPERRRLSPKWHHEQRK
jgi:Ni/Co efflux regulator RcnB